MPLVLDVLPLVEAAAEAGSLLLNLHFGAVADVARVSPDGEGLLSGFLTLVVMFM